MHFPDLRKVHKRMRCFIHFALLSFYILSYPDTSNAQKTGTVLIVSSAEHYRLGLGYAQKGDYKSAESAYKKALEMDANNIGPRDGLGFIYALQKRFIDLEDESHDLQKENKQIPDLLEQIKQLDEFKDNILQEKKKHSRDSEMQTQVVERAERHSQTQSELHEQEEDRKKEQLISKNASEGIL